MGFVSGDDYTGSGYWLRVFLLRNDGILLVRICCCSLWGLQIGLESDLIGLAEEGGEHDNGPNKKVAQYYRLKQIQNFSSYNYSKRMMAAMTPVWLFLLSCLFLTSRAVPTTYLGFVQTGSYSVDTTPYFNNVANRRIDARYNIPLSPSINTTTYRAGLCFDSVDLGLVSSRLSIGLRVYDRTNSILVVNVSSYSGDKVKVLKIRYLVVHPDYDFLYIHELVSPSSLGFVLSSSSYFPITLGVATYPSANCEFMLYLSGFDLTTSGAGKKLDIYPYLVSYSDTVMNFEMQTGLGHLDLDYFSLTIVVIDKVRMASRLGGEFIRGFDSVTNGKVVTYTNNSLAYYDNNTFFGLISFHMESEDRLILDSTTTATSLKVSSNPDMKYLEICYIIFAIDACPPPNFINIIDGSCVANCPGGYVGNSTTNMCQICSSNCASCVGFTSNCTACHNSTFYLQANTCQICNSSSTLSHCLECSSSSVCTRCDSLSVLNSSDQCDPDCTLLPHCSACAFAPGFVCSTCATGYSLSAGTCIEKCGDGNIIGSETCDDSNTADNDGCSSICQIENHFVCTGTPSVCILTSLGLTYKNLLKDPTGNSFTVTYQLSPASLPFYNSVNWKLAFLPGSLPISVEEAIYDPSTNTLTVRSSYTASLQGQSIAFQFDPAQTGATMLSSIAPSQVGGASESDNNLSLQHFSEQVYSLRKGMNWLAGAEGILAVLMFVAGYLGTKLIALECVAVVQLSYISLVSLKNIAPPFHALQHLRYSFGYTHTPDYDYSSALLTEFKGHLLSGDTLANYNLVLLFVFAPVLLAAGSKLLSVTLMKNRASFKTAWRRLLGEYFLYGLLFSGYTVFLSLGVSLRCWTGQAGNLVLGLLFLALIGGLTVVSNYYPKYFGEFKKRFQILNICQYTYNFEAIDRLVTPLLIATLTALNFQMLLVMLLVGGKLAFVAIRRPYVPDSWRRQTANLIIAEVILLLFLGCKLSSETSSFNLFAPAIIIALLGVCLGYNSLLLVRELRENWPVVSQEKVDSGQEMSVQENERLQFELFEKQMLPSNNEVLMSVISQSMGKMTAEQVDSHWQGYTNVSHNQIYGQIKQRLIKKKLNNSANSPQRKDSL